MNSVRCVLSPTCSCWGRHDRRIRKGLNIHDPFVFKHVSIFRFVSIYLWISIKSSTYRVADEWWTPLYNVLSTCIGNVLHGMQIKVYLADSNEVRYVLVPTCSCRWRHDQRIWKGLYIHDPFAFKYVSFQMYQFTCKFLYIKLSTYRVSDVWNSGPAGSSCWRIMTMVYTYLWCFKSNDTSMSWRTVHVLVYAQVLLIKKQPRTVFRRVRNTCTCNTY